MTIDTTPSASSPAPQRFWLIDAFDAVITELDRNDQWVESDARLAG
ncbi:hypothetical protein GS425_20700 [Rhodococcus hoagii]|nr:hypothetical protein [Prescottella equi]